MSRYSMITVTQAQFKVLSRHVQLDLYGIDGGEKLHIGLNMTPRFAKRLMRKIELEIKRKRPPQLPLKSIPHTYRDFNEFRVPEVINYGPYIDVANRFMQLTISDAFEEIPLHFPLDQVEALSNAGNHALQVLYKG